MGTLERNEVVLDKLSLFSLLQRGALIIIPKTDQSKLGDIYKTSEKCDFNSIYKVDKKP